MDTEEAEEVALFGTAGKTEAPTEGLVLEIFDGGVSGDRDGWRGGWFSRRRPGSGNEGEAPDADKSRAGSDEGVERHVSLRCSGRRSPEELRQGDLDDATVLENLYCLGLGLPRGPSSFVVVAPALDDVA